MMSRVFFKLDDDVVDGIRKAAGYHNYYNVGVDDAVSRVQEDLERAGLAGGWRARSLHSEAAAMPEDAIRVGQVRVRSGDPCFPLILTRVQEVK